ncbi:MAG: PilZ domain-containing protein [Myxococcota bacterium]|jgi:hypothetical protein|nr:PilZ domain-containing protein [Myxococcota bacterium]
MADKSNENIQATLKFDDGESADGIVVNITNRGLVVVCNELRNPESTPGRRVSLLLSGAGIETPQEAPGHIQGVRTEDTSHHRVVVWVDDPEDLDRLMSAGISATFNRRGAYRVAPSASEPIKVQLVGTTGGWTHEDQVANLSASGVAVLVDKAVAAQLEEAGSLTASLQLPGRPRPTVFVSHVRRSIPKGDEFLVGLDFDPDLTENFEDISDLIVDYIMRRQRELLREQRP